MTATGLLVRLALPVGLVVSLGGCGDSGYDRDDAFADLTSGDTPLTDEQANCFLDEVEDLGLEDEASNAVSPDDLAAEDAEAVLDALSQCTLGEDFEDAISGAVPTTTTPTTVAG